MFVQDKNLNVFTVVEGMPLITAVGSFVLFVKIFLPRIDVHVIIITVNFLLLHYLFCFA